MPVIADLRAREILDSRGRPTVECDVVLDDGTIGRASVPSGASTGTHEAVELRDGDPRRYRGRGVRSAVHGIAGPIRAAVIGRSVVDQPALDALLIDLDGTGNKRRLGANATLAVSLAAARAAAQVRGMPLFRHLADLAEAEPSIPLPRFNIISGGLHAGRQIDIQDILVIPTAVTCFADALHVAVSVHAAVADRLERYGFPLLVGDEGGWAPPLESNEAALAWVAEAIASEGVEARIALDVAATYVFDPPSKSYVFTRDGRSLPAGEWCAVMARWVDAYDVCSIEDGCAEDDWSGWQELTRLLGSRIELVGDDLFVTHRDRLALGIDRGIANAVLVKPNQIGTLTETLDVIGMAKKAGYATVVSARSGETEDPFIADLAVGSGAAQIKVGSVTRSSRLAKWNQLLRIEERLGRAAYVGVAPLTR
jgi:enolase